MAASASSPASSNSRIYNLLFGDSSLIVHYLKLIGWNLNKVEQTGSNFGTNQKHDNPVPVRDRQRHDGVGRAVDDECRRCRARSFKLGQVRIGDRNYLGNNIYFPPDGEDRRRLPARHQGDDPDRRAGARKASACSARPASRSRARSSATRTSTRRWTTKPAGSGFEKKNVHNLVTVAAVPAGQLGVRCFAMLFVVHAAVLHYPRYGLASLFVAGASSRCRRSCTSRCSSGRAWASGRCSRRSSRSTTSISGSTSGTGSSASRRCIGLFKGTPFKNVISRLLGVKVGRKVFDDGCQYLEKTLIEIGDYANLNEASTLQGHSLEEGVFKSDYIKIGNGCTLGVGAFVHYGVVHGRPCRARPRLLPDEGRDRRADSPLARKSGQGGAPRCARGRRGEGGGATGGLGAVRAGQGGLTQRSAVARRRPGQLHLKSGPGRPPGRLQHIDTSTVSASGAAALRSASGSELRASTRIFVTAVTSFGRLSL